VNLGGVSPHAVMSVWGGVALCVMSVFLPLWLVYPMKGSSMSISISLGLYRWFAIPWECF
jgi:hypothetical protein